MERYVFFTAKISKQPRTQYESCAEEKGHMLGEDMHSGW
jgi:hypothetical protein